MERKIKLSDRYLVGKALQNHRLTGFDFEYVLVRRCKIKVLVVIDTSGNSLTTFLRAFEDPLPYTSFDVTMASTTANASADIQNLDFASHDLSQYDVIFLFGVVRRGSIPDNEIRALAEFMDQGGGLFATGDHEDLGANLCGKIPRVRSMRRWYIPGNPGPFGGPFAPPQSGGQNHNTHVDTSPSPGLQGSDTDLFPQPIFPRYRYGLVTTGTSYLYKFVKFPHPVLCSIDGTITWLPDHMHEGLCEVPNDLTRTFSFSGYSGDEYPSVDGSRLSPEVIAEGTNHENNTRFGLITVLDGHKHDTIGRVLVDSTWHHFFNINIQQYQNIVDDIDNFGYTPTAVEAAALNKYKMIQHYFRNIAYWLARRDKQNCFRVRGWIAILNHTDIRMNVQFQAAKMDTFERLTYFHHLGTIARNALGDLQSQCQSLGLINVIDRLQLETTFTPIVKKENFSFIDPELIQNYCWGCTIHNLSLAVAETKGDISDKEINKIVEQSAEESLEELLDQIGKSITTFKRRARKVAKYGG